MGVSSTLRKAGFIVPNLFLLSYQACKEGAAHDYRGCVFDVTVPPPFLGFEYWTSVGIALAFSGVGVLIGTILFELRSDHAGSHYLLFEGFGKDEIETSSTCCRLF
jgi:hypothetical protein